nr:DUF4082 domain-containing protein [Actinopolymorpha cephalotaxi]
MSAVTAKQADPAAATRATSTTFSLWDPSTVPATPSAPDTSSVEVGVKFSSSVSGTINSIRFYKGPTNTGTHTADLWSSTGTRLATATFTNETATGWQQVDFSTPVAINANTTYVASYLAPNGGYAVNRSYFTSPFVNGPLTAAIDGGAQGGNGVFVYTSSSKFPTASYQATNYWVDVVFVPTPVPTYSLWDSSTVPDTASAADTSSVEVGVKFSSSVGGTINSIRFYKGPTNTGTHTANLWSSTGTRLATATFTNETATGWQQVDFSTPVAINANTTYVASYLAPTGGYAVNRNYFTSPRVNGSLTAPAGANGVYRYTKSSAFPSASYQATNYWVDVVFTPATPTDSLWDASTVPDTASAADTASLEVGVKFSSSVGGTISGIRFYKGPANTGTHTASLWSLAGARLATATFTNETAQGWQQVNFSAAVTIRAKQTYVASYFAPNGGYATSLNYFSNPYANAPLSAPIDGGPQGGNGVFRYADSSIFPVASLRSTNYWVDVVFTPAPTTSSLWTTSTVPETASQADRSSVEVGVKFSSSVGGTINGVRFYKGPANTGTHTADLWSSTGTRLATATFTNETATGWQQVDFSTPVTITANTTYVASYLAPNGGYATNRSYFTSPRVSGSLTAPAGANGVYRYTTTSAFPTASYQSTNYWVDVVFKADLCPPNSEICVENSKPGSPPSEWDISGAGSTNIQGYATQMSVNKGETVRFKVDTDSPAYRLDIYRIGYYDGDGARKITTIRPSAPLPQVQPACITDISVGLVDCANWSESASWAVPADAVSGVYIAKLVREDATAGSNQIIFVVRDDSGGSDVLVQTSDATWQAYNKYGGYSLYAGELPAGRAYKVSYNRPFTTRGSGCCNGSVQSWFFASEYPLIRWLEANGYDVSYTTEIDTATRGAEILEHKTFISSGHDEYWSNEMRSAVENARDAGVNLIFLSGNEIFWKTRWENSIDTTPYRTLVCYKETANNAKIDPSAEWTGTWQDPRFSPPSDGGRPQNAVTGTFFRVIGDHPLEVPYSFGQLRLWRNTSVANLSPGQTATFPQGYLGYEWDEAPDSNAPPGLVRYSQSTFFIPGDATSKYMISSSYGASYGSGTATHSLTLYRAGSGALVFGSGTVQWAWGLDANHDLPGTPPDIRVQQATVNLLADMKAQPATLQPGLVPATASGDTTPPTSVFTSPPSGSITAATVGTPTLIQGTASDPGGVVGAVEISLDNGATWLTAQGMENWQYTWTPDSIGTFTLRVRAVDDSGNLQTATPDAITVNVSP